MDRFSERIVDTMNAIHGRHDGLRAVHAKGWCCKGTFVGTHDAARVCVAEHFQGAEIPVTVRFSNGSGKPARADGAKDERGMAVKFHLADGSTTDIVSLTLPAFFVKTPEDFFEFLQTQVPDPATGKPDLDKVKDFVDRHPETQLALGFLMFSEAPASYATCTFNSIHAFKLKGPDGTGRFVRYRWVPEAPEATLTDEETRALGKEYLKADLERRLEKSVICFDLLFKVGTGEDDPNDPAVPWPEERRTIRAGTLTIGEFVDRECEQMIFDPGRLIEGIEPSDDPILRTRTPAYSVSFDRRSRASTTIEP